jgi:hypothetical protein
MAHGGHDCGVGSYSGLGIATAAACKPVVVPGFGGRLLYAVESLSERAQQRSATNDPRDYSREGTGCGGNGSCEGAAGGSGKSGNSETGRTSGFEIGGRSSVPESGN